MPSTRTQQNGSTAVATRPAEQPKHPIVAKIEEGMPTIAGMLPATMSPDRFRAVVVQALVRNPDLLKCTPASVITSVTEAAEAGLEPTGVLGKAWLIPYGNEAKLMIGWRGYAELAWRADRVLLTTGAVREGDDFSYQRGTGAYLHHVENLDDPDREADDANITYVWCLARFPDGREDFEVMSRKAVQRIVDRARRTNPVWASDFGEMARKTALRRLVKRLPLSPTVQRFLGNDEAIDFDTPVERQAASNGRADAARARIQERTAAMRGKEVVAEPEPEPEQPALDVDEIPFEQGDEALTGGAEGEASDAAASSPVASCTHPRELMEIRESGLVCRGCGELLQSADAGKPRRERSYRERLNARIHADRTHEQARQLTAAVLGMDPDSEWSMADLSEEQLAMVVGALEARSARPPQSSRRQPARSGR